MAKVGQDQGHWQTDHPHSSRTLWALACSCSPGFLMALASSSSVAAASTSPPMSDLTQRKPN